MDKIIRPLATPPEFKEILNNDRTIEHTTFTARVGHISDGDTFDVSLFISRYVPIYVWTTIRLYGVDAPELKSKDVETRTRAIKAKEYLTTLIPIESFITINIITSDQYKRLVSVVETLHNDRSIDVSNSMVEAGHAMWKNYS